MSASSSGGTNWLSHDPLGDARFRAPLPSIASRLPPLRSAGSSRGAVVCPTNLRAIVYESSLERKFLTLMLARPDVAEVRDQQPVTYMDAGVLKKHVFDFVVIRRSGFKTATAIKPFERAERQNFSAKLALIARQIDPEFADTVVLVTERDLDNGAVHDAELVLIAKRHDDPEADNTLGEVLNLLPHAGAISVEALVNLMSLGSRGFWAIARAIGSGRLIRVKHRRLDYRAWVSLARLDCAA